MITMIAIIQARVIDKDLIECLIFLVSRYK